ncbi:MAG: hypothetical protein M1823_009010, partial [Watsoniomyces obsoletus]
MARSCWGLASSLATLDEEYRHQEKLGLDASKHVLELYLRQRLFEDAAFDTLVQK